MRIISQLIITNFQNLEKEEKEKKETSKFVVQQFYLKCHRTSLPTWEFVSSIPLHIRFVLLFIKKEILVLPFKIKNI